MRRTVGLVSACLTAVLLGGCGASGGLQVEERDGHRVSIVCIAGAEFFGLGITPIRDRIIDTFEGNGFAGGDVAQIVETGCDATITLDVTGTPESGHYDEYGEQFTGATIEGTLTLSAEGFPSPTAGIGGRRAPSQAVNNANRSEPTSAPFWMVARPGVCAAFASWFGGTDLEALLSSLMGTRTTEC